MTTFLKLLLSNVLEEYEVSKLSSSFDVVGNIMIMKIPDALSGRRHVVGKTILDNIPSIRSVYIQTSPVAGDYRTRKLELIAGEDNPVTIYKEHGCRFKVDVERAFFSPRLSTERLRVAGLASDNEIVTNMFAGVGTFSIILCKFSNISKVFNIDINQVAVELSAYNSRLNKMEDKIECLCGDAKEIIRSHISGKSHRVIMPLPEGGRPYIRYAVDSLQDRRGVIHYFLNVRASSKQQAIEAGMVETQDAFHDYFHEILFSHVVREVGPCLYQLVSDVLIKG